MGVARRARGEGESDRAWLDASDEMLSSAVRLGPNLDPDEAVYWVCAYAIALISLLPDVGPFVSGSPH